MKLIICVCSRGLVHSRMVDNLDLAIMYAELGPMGEIWDRIWTHSEPIPQAQIEITQRALSHKAEFLLYVEEDIGLPMHAIDAMLGQIESRDVLSARYSFPGGGTAHTLDAHGRMLYGGMGCLLVRASVFDRIENPWFEVGWEFDGELNRGTKNEHYGGQDIWFYWRLKQAGIQPYLSDVVCEHYRVKQMGEPETNRGVHQVKVF